MTGCVALLCICLPPAWKFSFFICIAFLCKSVMFLLKFAFAWLLDALPALDVVEPLTTSVCLALALLPLFPALETPPVTLSLFTVKLCGVRFETRLTCGSYCVARCMAELVPLALLSPDGNEFFYYP